MWLRLTYIIGFFFLINSLSAQLIVNTGMPVNNLVNNVLLGGGVSATNIVFNGPANAIGYFDGSGSNIGLDEGIIIATGDVMNAIGPNLSTSTTTNFNLPGDPQLTALTTSNTFDAVSLEFDFIPTGDTLRFRYVFASEEYCEFVCDQFNDVFAFFLSGPGITGAVNIANVPGSTPPIPITIKNINNGDCSTNPPQQCGGNPLYYVDNTNGNNPVITSVQYDGFTVVLEAMAIVVPCSTYHIKIAIADVGDGAYDSAVFLEAGSFGSNGVTVTANAPDVNSAGQNLLPEGCAKASFVFTLSQPEPDTVVFYFDLTGTAQNGIDYVQIPDSIVIPPGQLSDSIVIEPLVDGLPELDETVILTITSSAFAICSNAISDTLIIVNIDSLGVEISPPSALKCGNNPVTLSTNVVGGIGPLTYSWAPGGMTTATVSVNPSTTTTYYVTVSDTCGNTATDSIVVQAYPAVNADIIPNTLDICKGTGEPVSTTVTGGTGTYTYVWTPTAGVSNSNSSNPVLNPSATQYYYFYAVDSVGCQSNTDSILVNVHEIPVVTAGPDTGLCAGQGVSLNASASGGSGTYSFTWTPASSLSNPSISNPYATPSTSTVYTVIATDQNTQCVSMPAYVQVLIGQKPTADAGPDKTVCVGDSVVIGGTPSGYIGTLTYQWSPASGLSDPNVLYPKASPSFTTTYFLTVFDNGCASDADSVTVFIESLPILSNTNPVFQEICPGDSVQLLVTGTLNTPYSIEWTPTAGLNDATILEPWASPDTTTTYYLNVQSGACQVDSILFYTVAIKDVAEVKADSTGKGFVYYCQTDTNGVTLPAQITGPYSSFSWTPFSYLSPPNTLNPFASPPTDTDYILTVQTNGCTVRDTVKLYVLSAPNISLPVDTTEFCTTDSVNIVATGGAGAATFTWYYIQGNDTTFIQGNSLNLPGNTFGNDTLGMTFYVEAYEMSKFCKSKDSVFIKFHPVPDAQIFIQPQVQCNGDTVHFQVIKPSDLSNITTIWDLGDGSFAQGGDVNYVYQTPGKYTATATLYYNYDSTCKKILNSDGIIYIVEKAQANFYSEPSIGDTLYLPNSGIQFYDSSSGDVVKYYWDFGDNEISEAKNPYHHYKYSGNYEVMLIAFDAAGCSDSVKKGLYIIKVPLMEPIPNVFTPNGDGVNDIFIIDYEGSQEFLLQIFDRWGRRVFVSDASEKGWNGLLPNGNEAPEGTYFYTCKVGKELFKGSVTLIR